LELAIFSLMSTIQSQAGTKSNEPVLYAKVPEGIKAATEAHAAETGLTLAGAVAQLLERGLEGERTLATVAKLESRVTQLSADKVTLQSELHGARSELQALGVLGNRVRQTVGRCPNPDCGAPISGYDLLATGACGVCGSSLSNLLVGKSEQSLGLNQQDFLLLIGALGAVVGVALLAAKGA
jgi:hypothetical protein